MSTITMKDGTTIYYKDWGKGPVVTLSHGWPLNSDMWDGQMLFLAQHGFRVVAHDRRGHGRSSQAWSGNDMDGYADDLAAVIEALDLNDITMVGHSTGGGEVARYIGRHGTKRVAKAVLIAAVPPIMLKSAANPEGLPIELFDSLRSALGQGPLAGVQGLRSPFYGANRPGAQVSQGTLDQFWLWSMQAGLKNAYDSIKAFSETDFTEDLKKFDIPTLVMHGEDDQIVPVKDSGKESAKLIKGAAEIYYPGLPHGLTGTHPDLVNRDLLAFIQQGKRAGHRKFRMGGEGHGDESRPPVSTFPGSEILLSGASQPIQAAGSGSYFNWLQRLAEGTASRRPDPTVAGAPQSPHRATCGRSARTGSRRTAARSRSPPTKTTARARRGSRCG